MLLQASSCRFATKGRFPPCPRDRKSAETGAMARWRDGATRAETSGPLATSDDGPFAGLGVDYALTDLLRAGAKVLQHQFDNFADSGVDIETTTLNARVAHNS
jgi:hypothetical protein